jgi:hypothetical protein
LVFKSIFSFELWIKKPVVLVDDKLNIPENNE